MKYPWELEHKLVKVIVISIDQISVEADYSSLYSMLVYLVFVLRSCDRVLLLC